MDKHILFTHPKQGILSKKGMGNIFRTWKTRRIVLDVDYTISYFDGDELKGKLTVENASVKAIDPTDGYKNCFEVYNLPATNGKKSNLILSADNPEVRHCQLQQHLYTTTRLTTIIYTIYSSK